MAAVSELKDRYVITVDMEDNFSAAAQAGAEKLGKLNVEMEGVSRGGVQGEASIRRLKNSLDPYTAALDAAVRNMTLMSNETVKNKMAVEEYARYQLIAADRVELAKSRLADYNRELANGSAVIRQLRSSIDPYTTSLNELLVTQERLKASQADIAPYEFSRLFAINADAIAKAKVELAEFNSTIGNTNQEVQRITSTLDRYTTNLDEAVTQQARLKDLQGDMSTEKYARLQLLAADNVNKAKAALAENNAELTTNASQVNRLTSSLDKYATALAAAKAQLAEVNTASVRNNTSAEQYSRLQAYATANVAKATDEYNASAVALKRVQEGGSAAADSQKNMRASAQNLTIQMQDLIQQLAAGQAPLQAFIQQGGQIIQVNTAMGISFGQFAKQLGEWALWFVRTPIGLTITTIATVATSLYLAGTQAETAARKHALLSSALSGVRGDYDRMATTVTNAARIAGRSMTDAATAVEAASLSIAKVSVFQGTTRDLTDLTRTAGNLAKVMGTTLPDAAKLMAIAMNDPRSAIEELAKSPETMRLVSADTLSMALALSETGHQAKAAALLINDLDRANRLADQGMTPLQSSLKNLSDAFGRTSEDGKGAWRSLGEFVDEIIASIINGIANLKRKLDEIVTYFQEHEHVFRTIAAAGLGATAGGLALGPAGAVAGGVLLGTGAYLYGPGQPPNLSDYSRQRPVDLTPPALLPGSVDEYGRVTANPAKLSMDEWSATNPLPVNIVQEGGRDLFAELFGIKSAEAATNQQFGLRGGATLVSEVPWPADLMLRPGGGIRYTPKEPQPSLTPEQQQEILKQLQEEWKKSLQPASFSLQAGTTDWTVANPLPVNVVEEAGKAPPVDAFRGGEELFNALLQWFQGGRGAPSAPSAPTSADMTKGIPSPVDLPALTTKLGDMASAMAKQTNVSEGQLNQFFMALQHAENAPQGGFWPSSPTGARGAMQVTDTTLQDILNLPGKYPLTASQWAATPNPGSQELNATAGSEHAAILLQKYKSVRLATLAYHDGEKKIDDYLKGLAQPSPEAEAQAARVVSEMGGPGALKATDFSDPTKRLVGSTTIREKDWFGADQAEAARAATLAIKATNDAVVTAQENFDKARAALQGYMHGDFDLAKAEQEVKTATGEHRIELEAQIKGYTDLQANAARAAGALDRARDSTLEQVQADRQHIEVLKLQSPAAQKQLELQNQINNETRKGGLQYGTQEELDRRRAANTERMNTLIATQTAEFDANIREMDRGTARIQEQADSYRENAAAVERKKVAQEAELETIKLINPASDNYKQKLDEETAAIERRNAAERARSLGPINDQLRDNIQYTQAQIDAIGQDTEQSTINLAVMKERQSLLQKDPLYTDAAMQKTLELTAAEAKLTYEFQEQRKNLDYLSGMFTSAFDTIGNAMAQAFVQGQGQAVNWGNIMKSVLEQVIQKFIQLSLLNPIKNLLFAQNEPTLLGVMGTMDRLWGGGGYSYAGDEAMGGGGPGSIISGAGQAYSLYNMTQGGGILSRLGGGLSNIWNGLLTNFGSGGVFSPGGLLGGIAPEFMTAPLFYGPSALGTGAGAPEVLSALRMGAVPGMGMPVTVGGLLTGGLAGFGGGAMLGGLVQRLMGRTGPGPMIGAAAGTAAGLGVGLGVGAIGGPLGMLIGGLIGGAGGGLFGPKPPQPFSLTNVGITGGGMLDTLTSYSQAMGSDLAQQQQAIAQMNAQMQSLGVQISGYQMGGYWAGQPMVGRGGQIGSFGTNYGRAGETNWQGADVNAVFSQFRFGAEGRSDLNRWLQGQSFGDINALATAVTQFKTFVDQTIPSTLQFGKVTGSLNDALKQISATFDPVIAQAKAYGLATDELAAAQAVATAKANKASTDLLQQLNVSMDVATWTAQLQASAANQNTPAGVQQQENIALYAFDQQAAVQARRDLHDQLAGMFGDARVDAGEFANEFVKLETQLGAQRLAIAKGFEQQIAALNDQAKAVAASAIQNLADYTKSLATSNLSPTSPMEQFGAAQKQYQEMAAKAQQGDITSIQNLPNVANTYLNLARTIYGSGADYAAIFQSISDTLNAISKISPDTLTASVFALETRTQTEILKAALDDLTKQVTALRSQLTSNNNQPARIAA